MKRVLMGLLVITILFPTSMLLAANCGDANKDGLVNILDIVYLIDYKFKDGPAPEIMAFADVNSDGLVDILDIIYLIDYKFKGGPVPNCGQETGTVTDIDGNVYQTIKIGDQWWMVENLKVTHYRNGDPIPEVTDNGAWGALTTSAYCNYNNDINSVATYGRLYNWYAVNDSRNIAPSGWHVPSDEEWKQLEMYLGMSQAQADGTEWRGTDEGGKLKRNGTTYWYPPNQGATNESGFSALPGGFRSTNGYFDYMSVYADFWTSSVVGSSDAWYRDLRYNNSQVNRDYINMRRGFSVRCVRD